MNQVNQEPNNIYSDEIAMNAIASLITLGYSAEDVYKVMSMGADK